MGAKKKKSSQQQPAEDAALQPAPAPAPTTTAIEMEEPTETSKLVSSSQEPPRYDGTAAVPASPTNCAPGAAGTLDPAKRREMTAIRIATIFCVVFMCVEVVGGYMANSLAILTDAAHLLTDVGAFILALYTLHATTKGSDHVYSYGYHRAEVVGTLASVFTIWALVGAIVVESFSRLHSVYQCATMTTKELHAGNIACEAVKTQTMITIGVLGLAVNLSCAAILSWGGSHGHSHGLGGGHGHAHDGDDHGHSHGGADDHGHAHGDHVDEDHGHGGHGHGEHSSSQEDPAGEIHGHSHAHGEATGSTPKGSGSLALNAAFLHALGDSVQSVGVILAGFFIYYMNQKIYGHHTEPRSLYNLADPCCSLLFSVVTLYTTKSLIWQILAILMETTPEYVDYGALRQELSDIAGVENVHDLHVWSLTANQAALSVHVVAVDQKEVLQRAQDVCSRHGIEHTTIQVDPPEVGAEKCISRMGCHNC